MKQILIAIFAHPDDEAFGPAGTLLKLKSEGYDIHLILLTDGEAGANPDQVANLGAIRLQEWQQSANQLEASSTVALHLPDGELELIDAAELDAQLNDKVSRILSQYSEPIELSIITFEPNGLTGHLDHIAASQAATELFEGLRSQLTTSLWYFCLDSSQAPLDGTAYYEPRARGDEFITTRVDISPFLTEKYALMDCHVSQHADAIATKNLGDELLRTECFRVVS